MWNVVAAASASGSNLLVALVLANVLGRERFGEFAIVQSTIASVAGIAQVAMGLAATKFVAQYREENKERVGRILGLCSVITTFTALIAAALLLLGASFIAETLLVAPSLAGYVAFSAGAVLFVTMNGFQVGALAGLEQYRGIAGVSFGSAVIHVALCAVLAILGGLEAVIIGLIASAAAKWLLFNTALNKEARKQGIKVTTQASAGELGVLVNFAAPASLAGLSALSAIWFGNALLVRQESGLAQMGLYAAANSLRALLLFFPALVNGVGASVINYFASTRHASQYREAFWVNFRITCTSLIVGAFVLALAGDALLSLFGHEFSGAYVLLIVMVAGAVVEGTGIAAYQIVQSKARMWMSLCLIAVPRDVLIVALAWILVPQYGAIGLATGNALAALAALILVVGVTMKIGLVYSPHDARRQELTIEPR